MIDYKTLLTFGDFIPLAMSCSVDKLFDEIKGFDFKQYQPRKDIKRYALSITSLRGEINGIDLDNIYEIYKETGKMYSVNDFSTFTAVYNSSLEIQNLIKPFKDYIAKSHIINLPTGGYFPPHRDMRKVDNQESFRILVPIRGCNMPELYFMYEDKPLHFNMGNAYFVNTNKMHSIFSFTDNAYMLVMNIECTDESLKKVGELIKWK